MFNGIITLFNIAEAITNKQISSSPPIIDNEKTETQKQNDKRFLLMLKQINWDLGSGSEICTNITSGITDSSNQFHTILSLYSDLGGYLLSSSSTSTNNRFINSCVLNKGSHRVIIAPSTTENNKYILYSCILESDNICNFERNN